jgi:hypothetical protein
MHRRRARRHSSRGSSRAIDHLTRTLRRYRRDFALMTGATPPDPANVDDVVLLDYFSSGNDPRAMIVDRMLRIKTLEATVGLLRQIGDCPG